MLYERLFNILVVFTLSALAFTLVAFGFEWIYQMWLAEEISGMSISFIAIPLVALVSALLIYMFFYALGDAREEENTYHPRSYY